LTSLSISDIFFTKKNYTPVQGLKKSTSPTLGASNFHIWASWNSKLYARRASKKYIGYWQTCQYSRIYLYSYMLYVVYWSIIFFFSKILIKILAEAILVGQVRKRQSQHQHCHMFVLMALFLRSSTNKTDRHNITEMFLKVALNTITQPDLRSLRETVELQLRIH
jgi:hypothetical protein